MAYKTYGNTWWGKAWLNALHHIDYQSRIPRGLQYARNGSVLILENKKKFIYAEVQGRLSTPYKVRIKKIDFTEEEQQKIRKLILSNPFYLSQLGSRKLPHILLEELDKIGISLFPHSWKDMEAHCSCPDWAVPCKHIAAVVYLIANEIDKNPFLVFEFHNYNLLEDIDKAGNPGKIKSAQSSIGIPLATEFLAKKNKTAVSNMTDLYEYLGKCDFSVIKPLASDILSTLKENPLFVSGSNFKQVLAEMYKYHTREAHNFYKKKTPAKDNKYTASRLQQLEYNWDKGQLTAYLESAEGEKISISDKEGFLEFLQEIDFTDLSESESGFLIFWFCISFVQHILRTGAYIPYIYQSSEELFHLQWYPALFQEQAAEIINYLQEAFPPDILRVTYNKTEYLPDQRESLLLIISGIISAFQKEFFQHLNNTRDLIKISSFFFNDFNFRIQEIEDREIPQTIHLWLSRFYLADQGHKIILKIDETETGKEFLFEILIKTDTEDNSLPLKSILRYKKYDKLRFRVLLDLSLLGEYLPAVNSFLANNAENPVIIDSQSFVPVWFESLPLMNILGVCSLLPHSLSHIIKPKLTLSAKLESTPNKVRSYLDLIQLLSFDWKIALGNVFVDPEEFFKIVDQYTGIVRFKDRYLHIDVAEIKKLMRAAEKEIPSFSPAEILRLGIEGEYEDVKINMDSNIRDIFARMFKVDKTSLPENINATLRDYQKRGFHWLHHNERIGFGSIIADDMGLGKTLQVITLLLRKKQDKELQQPVLIIVPTTLITNWNKEFEKFAPSLKVSTYHGSSRQLDTSADAILTTYGTARSDVLVLGKNKWNLIILDEAQNIKNPVTKQTKAIKSIKSYNRIAMTGTPVENSLQEYWSIMDFLNQGLLGNQTSFKKDFAIPIEKERDKSKLDKFLRITSPFILRRTKQDKEIIKDLPDKIVIDQYCNLSEKQSALYQSIIDKMMTEIDSTDKDGIQRKGLVFKLLTSLKQICNHPVNFLKEGNIKSADSGKLSSAFELLEKILKNREKCLIFTQYTEMGNILAQAIRQELNTVPLFLHGGLSRKNRDCLIESFQNDPHSRIFILSLKAGGTGLNLTAANHVIHYDLWWNPAVENQATDRAFRIGQNKNVNVYRFITEGTFEERINAMLEAKKELFDLSVKTGENWISELSNDQLKELISLSQPSELKAK